MTPDQLQQLGGRIGLQQLAWRQTAGRRRHGEVIVIRAQRRFGLQGGETTIRVVRIADPGVVAFVVQVGQHHGPGGLRQQGAEGRGIEAEALSVARLHPLGHEPVGRAQLGVQKAHILRLRQMHGGAVMNARSRQGPLQTEQQRMALAVAHHHQAQGRPCCGRRLRLLPAAQIRGHRHGPGKGLGMELLHPPQQRYSEIGPVRLRGQRLAEPGVDPDGAVAAALLLMGCQPLGPGIGTLTHGLEQSRASDRVADRLLYVALLQLEHAAVAGDSQRQQIGRLRLQPQQLLSLLRKRKTQAETSLPMPPER